MLDDCRHTYIQGDILIFSSNLSCLAVCPKLFDMGHAECRSEGGRLVGRMLPSILMGVFPRLSVRSQDWEERDPQYALEELNSRRMSTRV